MGKALLAIGKVPQKWDSPLQEHIQLHNQWHGHYSCLHPWPKSREDLEERQSCAEDWNSIDPMTLDFEVTTTNQNGSFWPPLFSTIAVFDEVVPHQNYAKELNLTYIRGIAPFVELKEVGKHSLSSSSAEHESIPSIPKWHPFTASRVHGIVHDIPVEATFGSKSAQDQAVENEEEPIPGWKHIMMIVYKPCTRALLSVLEHAEEDYGGTSDIIFNTASIWNTNNNGDDTASLQNTGAAAPSAQTQAFANQNIDVEDDDSSQAQSSEERIEAQLEIFLARRIRSFTITYSDLLATQLKHHDQPETVEPYLPSYTTKPKSKQSDLLPPLWSPAHIRQLQDSFSPVQHMTWDDGTIEYAYAYEGVIIPGGKIMFGRFWRIHGVEGMGSGKEIGPDGVGVEVRPVHQPSSSSDRDEEDADYQDDSKKKSRAKTKGQSRRKTKKRKNRKMTKEIDDEQNIEDDSEFEGQEEKNNNKKGAEYEFVTRLNGEESRAQNACKGLERGPFVFWAT